MGQHVFIADLFKAIAPAEAKGFISNLALAGEVPAYHFPPLGPGGAFNPAERTILARHTRALGAAGRL